MNVQWYYSEGGQRRGPVPAEQLKNLIAAGNVKPDTLVWKQGMAQWTPAGQVAELQQQEPPPLPGEPPPIPGVARPRRTLRFEADSKPAVTGAAPPPPQPPDPPSTGTSGAAAPLPKPAKPSRPPLSVSDALIAPFVVAGAIGLAVVAGLAGSAGGGMLFMFVALVCMMASWIRLSIFLYKAWAALPWKAQTVKPALAAASIWIPIANLALVFRAVHRLSTKTNEVLAERRQKPTAPQSVGMAVCIGFVLMILLPLAVPHPGVALLYGTAVIALVAHWMALQCHATNSVLGHTDVPMVSKGLRIGVLSCGGIALLIALSIINSVLSPRSSRGYEQPGVQVPGPLLDDGMSGYTQRQPQRTAPAPDPWRFGTDSGWGRKSDPPSNSSWGSQSQPTSSGTRPSTDPFKSNQSRTCSACGGSGTGSFACIHCDRGVQSNGMKCTFCNGRGFGKCTYCNGTGRTR